MDPDSSAEEDADSLPSNEVVRPEVISPLVISLEVVTEAEVTGTEPEVTGTELEVVIALVVADIVRKTKCIVYQKL